MQLSTLTLEEPGSLPSTLTRHNSESNERTPILAPFSFAGGPHLKHAQRLGAPDLDFETWYGRGPAGADGYQSSLQGRGSGSRAIAES